MTTEEMAERYRSGESTGEIAEAAGTAQQSVRDRLLRAGVRIRSAREARALARAKGRAWTKFHFTMRGT